MEKFSLEYECSGKQYTVSDSLSDGRICVERSLSGEARRVTLRAEKELTIRAVKWVIPFAFGKDDKIFTNGYQSWSLSKEYSVEGYDSSLEYAPADEIKRIGAESYGDALFYKNPYKRGVMHGYTYGYVRRNKKFFLFASLNERSGFTRFIFDVDGKTIAVEKDCAGRELCAGEEYCALSFALYTGAEDKAFDGWFSDINIKPKTDKKLIGYTSWYNYYQNISAEVIERDLSGLKALPVKPDVFQIDDGFESAVGDWLKVDGEKFPRGLKPIADKIKAEGYLAGIWLAPFVCEKKSELFKNHRDWLVKDENGEPLFLSDLWSGMYAIDIYNAEAREYIERCLSAAVNEWGFNFLKLDFLYGVCLCPRKNKTRGEIMFDAMDIISSSTAGAQILGCGVPLAAAFGRVEYCRVGTDMSLEWEGPEALKLFHSERPSTKNTMFNSLFRRQLSGRAFVSDPDVFTLRDYNLSLTPAQRIALGTVNALSGGILFASDDFSRYSDKERELFKYLLSLRGGKITSAYEEDGKMKIRYSLNGGEHGFEYKI